MPDTEPSLPSLDDKCTDLKRKYGKCFNKWYTEKLLNGVFEDDCRDLFTEYRQCVDVIFPLFLPFANMQFRNQCWQNL
ncbi:hypothetical protein ROZALSC1DRAFT_16742 [Rozella allomycis CSF55]|uniref:Uncharacterized protein n=1 Tax=Rozella allomycis (strain CSF55) TaxID=988480 RepID=A0A4P9YFN3_ROZAC|nr:hypothetical protein ROZALSC1DRAFT_16742 [Rozella allomycis CSF55]